MVTAVNKRGWIVGALLAPLLLIGVLLGAMANADTATERIPIALVNNDEIIIETDDNGEETFFLASRPLVLELVGGDDLTLDWIVTDSAGAARMLEAGEVYAIFEIPDDFSETVKTLETTNPQQSTFTIRTNPARSYLAGVLAEQIGSQVAAALNEEFGKEILDGLFSVIVDLGDAFTEAADASREISDGVTELSDGVGELSGGVRELRDGTADLARGYQEFDDGLNQYTDGVGALADGLGTFERQTRDLPQLTDGVRAYTGGTSLLIISLEALDNPDAFPGLLPAIEAFVNGALAAQGLPAQDDFLDGLKAGGPALTTGVDEAVTGVRKGLVETSTGARELATASDELLDGSREIRSGTRELSSGVGELNDGVADLNDGVGELADGVKEFADALGEGADEIASESLGQPSDQTLIALVSPISSGFDSGGNGSTASDNIASIIIPLGLWLSGLLVIVLLPAQGVRAFSSTVSSSTLMFRSLAPALVTALGQGAVALTLLHTLGGVSLSALGFTTPLVLAGALAYTSVHFLMWAWSPRIVVPISLAVLVVQIATFGVFLPAEILPPAYQAIAGWGPLSWLADALLAAAAGDTVGRVFGTVVGLALTSMAAMAVSRMFFGRRRHRVVRDYYLTGVSS